MFWFVNIFIINNQNFTKKNKITKLNPILLFYIISNFLLKSIYRLLKIFP